MPRHAALFLAMATLCATAAVSNAQSAYPAGPNDSQNQPNPTYTQSHPAPIERSPNTNEDNTYTVPLTAGEELAPRHGIASAQPAPGIFLRVGRHSAVRAVKVSDENTELKLEQGVANVSVHHPAKSAQILIDLPGGQTALVKDGLYTFNANTNTVRVLKGEAFAYVSLNSDQKPVKIKQDHAFTFNSREVKAFEFDPFEARADLIPLAPGTIGKRQADPYNYDGYGSYGFALGGYPYFDYGFADPFGYYPFGLGFYDDGFYGGGLYGGGFYGGGGGWRGGDHDGDGGHGGRGGHGGGSGHGEGGGHH